MERTRAQEQWGKEVRTVAVIGAGPRGRWFARRCLHASLDVVLEDVLSSNLRRAEETLRQPALELQGELRLSTSVEDAVRGADVAIDFVPDELESKLEIFSMMDRMAPPRTIFCTPTDLSLTDLASCTYRPDRCVGLKPLRDDLFTVVDLVRGKATSDATVAMVTCWFEVLGATLRISVDPALPI